MTDNVYLLPDERMGKWLQTRQPLYSQLDYQDVTPLEMPADVVEWLNNEVGPPSYVLENTPYPIWRVREPKLYNLETIRSFLVPYSLTAYQGADFWHKKYGWAWSVIVTPRVPVAIIEKLNHELAVTGKEVHNSPCFIWAVNLEPSHAEKLLIEIRKMLEEYPIVPHLVCDIASQPSKWSTELRIIEEYFLQCSIAVAPTTNKFDIMRFYRIDGANYGLSTEDIIKEMMLLDKQYGIDFIGLADVQLKRVPEGNELQELEDWFRSFCPDLAYDSESITALAKGRISVWWD